MAKVAVVAHARKSFGRALPELRQVLAREGVTDPLWYEVRKSRKAPKYARRAAAEGADLILAWGGDGTVQRCIDAVAGTGAVIGSCPPGPRICWPRTWACLPTTWVRRFGSACTGIVASSIRVR